MKKYGTAESTRTMDRSVNLGSGVSSVTSFLDNHGQVTLKASPGILKSTEMRQQA